MLSGVVDERIKGALDQLTEVERTALLLASRGLSGREVAAAIGRSEAATRTMMCRARLRFREHMAGEAGR